MNYLNVTDEEWEALREMKESDDQKLSVLASLIWRIISSLIEEQGEYK